ncbi:MAG: galactokinase [Anaerolineales bacterium]|nr:galactokinase [Anaerolineales bacterium]
MEYQERKTYIEQQFEEIYGERPSVWAQAPGRVDLMGSHTDYNEGYVLTQTIDRNTWIAALPRENEKVRIASLNSDGTAEIDLGDIQHSQSAAWTDYVGGVASILKEEGYELRGFDGLVHSTVPFGSGLSSSAALEVASAVLFDHLGDLNINPVDIAKLCQRAEREFVGMNCGILDQYSSAMGKAGQVLLLDCRYIRSETRPIAGDLQVVVCDTRAPRALTGSEYPERRAQCEQGARLLSQFYPEIKTLRDASLEQLDAQKNDMPEVVARRCRFIIQENQRVLDMAEALAEPDYDQIGWLAGESFAGARDLYQISCNEMEKMIAAMDSGPGVIGARQAGAGFGGCMVAFVHQEWVNDFSQHVKQHYKSSTSIDPYIYPVLASAGAGILDF